MRQPYDLTRRFNNRDFDMTVTAPSAAGAGNVQTVSISLAGCCAISHGTVW